jgi:uncharacterized protein YegP (UPF0339 family)
MRFEIFRDQTDEFAWELIDSESNVVAQSAVTYVTRADCVASIEAARQASAAYVLDLTESIDRLRDQIRTTH